MAHHEPSATHHVKDTPEWQFFDRLFGDEIVWHLPKVHLPFGFELQLTKFMLIELVVAALILIIFIPIARKARDGSLPRGRWWNAFESLLTFVRNEIARPNLGDKEADRYVPFLWTQFLFILFCNLLGLIPFLGSPTASIWATGALALCSFIILHGAAVVKMGHEEYAAHVAAHAAGHGGGHGTPHEDEHGPGLTSPHGRPDLHAPQPGFHGFMARVRTVPVVGPILVGLVYYTISMWPGIDVPYVGWIFSVMIFFLELLSSVIKSGVLAVRLFANMFAGHMVLATILLFIYMVGKGGFSALWPAVTLGSVVGVASLSLLEIFVAFLQAYIFTFLTALFMGMQLNPQH